MLLSKMQFMINDIGIDLIVQNMFIKVGVFQCGG